MRNYAYDHVHLRSPDPDATARFFETMFDAEVARGVYPPGTLYPGQMRVTMKIGGQKVLIAPTHPHDPTADAPRIPYYGLEHIGLTVDDVDAACDELRAKGADIAIGPLTAIPARGSRSFAGRKASWWSWCSSASILIQPARRVHSFRGDVVGRVERQPDDLLAASRRRCAGPAECAACVRRGTRRCRCVLRSRQAAAQ